MIKIERTAQYGPNLHGVANYDGVKFRVFAYVYQAGAFEPTDTVVFLTRQAVAGYRKRNDYLPSVYAYAFASANGADLIDIMQNTPDWDSELRKAIADFANEHLMLR